MVDDTALDGPRGEADLVGIRFEGPVEDRGARGIVQLSAGPDSVEQREQPDVVLRDAGKVVAGRRVEVRAGPFQAVSLAVDQRQQRVQGDGNPGVGRQRLLQRWLEFTEATLVMADAEDLCQ